jgi:hypothetical protein
VLLTGSGDELCGLLPALFQAVAYHHLLSALLPFQPLFIESSCGDQLLASPSFSGVLLATLPLCCVLVFSSLFSVLFSFFFSFFVGQGVSLPRGLCLFIPRVTGEIPHDAWCSSVWYVECLPSRFGADVWQWWEPSYFLSVTIWRSFPQATGLGC